MSNQETSQLDAKSWVSFARSMCSILVCAANSFMKTGPFAIQDQSLVSVAQSNMHRFPAIASENYAAKMMLKPGYTWSSNSQKDRCRGEMSRGIEDVGKMKKDVRQEVKLLFGGCPREYIEILRIVDTGQFFEEPKYSQISNLLRQAMRNLGAKEYPYDWETELNNKQDEQPTTASESKKK